MLVNARHNSIAEQPTGRTQVLEPRLGQRIDGEHQEMPPFELEEVLFASFLAWRVTPTQHVGDPSVDLELVRCDLTRRAACSLRAHEPVANCDSCDPTPRMA